MLKFPAHGGELTDGKIARQERDEMLLSDPAVAINFVRHVAALVALLSGRTSCRTGSRGPAVVACLAQEWSEFKPQLGLFSLTGRDHVLLRFDREDPLGRPTAIDVVRHVGDQLETDTGCGLWSPVDDGRALVISRSDHAPRYFGFDPARPLVVHHGMPAIAIEPGCRRAGLRFEKLARSPKLLKQVEGSALRTTFTGMGPGRMSVEQRRAVA